MKALIYDGVKTLNYRDAPKPKPQADQHLVRVDAVGICGSDMHAYLGHDDRRPAPLILGHEAAGTIIGGPRDGQRVTVNPLVHCGTCPACLAKRENICPARKIISMPPREGAFAEYIVMRDENLVSLPDGYALEKAALAEPLAVSWHAARLALAALHPEMERRALVLGGGTIGLAAALCLRAMGCADITLIEPNAARRAYLRDHCHETVVPHASAQSAAPLIVDAVGHAATRKIASDLAEPGGVIAHIGLGDGEGGLDIRRMTLQEITFIGTYTYTAQDFRHTAQAMFDGRLGPLDWVDQRALSEGATAFDDLYHNRVPAPKIVLHPHPS